MIWGHELNAAEIKLKEDPKQWDSQTQARQKRLITAQAYFSRIDRTSGEQQELSECFPMARALFGERLEKALEELHHQFWIVQIDVESYLDDEGGDADFTKKIRRGMYDVSPRDGEQNEVSERIAASVAEIESICLPALGLT